MTSAGSKFGRYLLVREIGRGSIGSLWLASGDEAAGAARSVTVRVIVRSAGLDQAAIDRICEAAWSSIELRHAAISSVLDVAISPEHVAVVNEHFDATPLGDLLRRARTRGFPLPTDVALHVATDALAALGIAHALWDELGEVTRAYYGGLLPESMLVAKNGQTQLIDLGVAGALVAESPTGSSARSSEYRAPELRRADTQVDARADVFTVGVLLWEMLANRRLLPAVLAAPDSVLATTIPEALGRVIARAVDPDPRRRFESAEDMARELRTVAASELAVRPPVPSMRPVPPRPPAVRQSSAASAPEPTPAPPPAAKAAVVVPPVPAPKPLPPPAAKAAVVAPPVAEPTPAPPVVSKEVVAEPALADAVAELAVSDQDVAEVAVETTAIADAVGEPPAVPKALVGGSESVAPVSRSPKATPHSRRWVAVAAAVGLISVVIGVGRAWRSEPSTTSVPTAPSHSVSTRPSPPTATVLEPSPPATASAEAPVAPEAQPAKPEPTVATPPATPPKPEPTPIRPGAPRSTPQTTPPRAKKVFVPRAL